MNKSGSVFTAEKFLAKHQVVGVRKNLFEEGKRLVLTNGCFDLLHAGHVAFLRDAASCGDSLWVGINSDSSVRRLKGSNRPVYPEQERVYLLNALACVAGVFVFDNVNFVEEISLVKPEVYVKAGDYSLETINPLERQALEVLGVEIRFLPFFKGLSTTNTLNKISCHSSAVS